MTQRRNDESQRMKTVDLTQGESVPALGLGTWRMGESASRRSLEAEAIRAALRMGYRLIDTAEMYGEGGAERVVGAAIADVLRNRELRRNELFVVSKVYPHHASRQGVQSACRASLERLGLESIDLYLLHWPGEHPLAQTVVGFEALRAAGLIRHWGVSNFDLNDLARLMAVADGSRCAANQVWYSANQRGPEFDLFPWMRQRRMPAMAYSPIDQSALARHPRLRSLAHRRGVSAATLALAWAIRDGATIAIPKSTNAVHLRENLEATRFEIDDELRAAVDEAFPPPRASTPLAVN